MNPGITRALSALSLLLFVVVAGPGEAGESPQGESVRAALRRACQFYHDQCGKHGGYVWRYSRDLRLSEGEGEAGPDTVWVQPPGTPAIGMAFLEAYDATGEQPYLDWGREAAQALVRGQLQSGGWYYRIEFDPAERASWGYRDNSAFRPSSRRKNSTNITTLDDDTTTAALRLLIRVDQRLDQSDAAIHESAQFALKTLLSAQYPSGGWYQNWDRPPQEKSASEFPVVRASYPPDWSRKWLNDWPGRYYTNDNVTGNIITTLLEAWEVYGDTGYRDAAMKTGDFLLLAQMPEPQPAWAQQYDDQMQPCWDRKFEPPAISGHESQEVIQALLLLATKTGEAKYLEPIPRAMAYLQRSTLPDGRLARFYELMTNRPLYFTKDYQLTYDSRDAPTHYGFVFDSELDALEAEYRSVQQAVSGRGPKRATGDSVRPQDRDVQAILRALDDRGAWVDAGNMKGFGKASREGVIQSETFVRNVSILCRSLEASN
jgi:hypothetical protein